MNKYHWHLVAGGGLSGYYIYTEEKVFTKEEIVELLESLEAKAEQAELDHSAQEKVKELEAEVEKLRSPYEHIYRINCRGGRLSVEANDEEAIELYKAIFEPAIAALEAGGVR